MGIVHCSQQAQLHSRHNSTAGRAGRLFLLYDACDGAIMELCVDYVAAAELSGAGERESVPIPGQRIASSQDIQRTQCLE